MVDFEIDANPDYAADEGKPGAPPYISFLQFINLLQWLGQEGVPHRIDRSFWSRKYSGSMGPQMLSGLRFLGLLKGDQPQPMLERLVEAKGEDQKAILLDVLKVAYGEVRFDLLAKATPGMVTEWLGKYSGEGDTKRKVESFFINALKYVDYPLAPALKKMARNRAAKGTTQRNPAKPKVLRKPGDKPDDNPNPPGKSAPVNARKVGLASGGEVTLSVDVDLFALSEQDRAFVMRLVDEIRKYETGSSGQGDRENNG